MLRVKIKKMSFGISSHSVPRSAVVSLPGGKTITSEELDELASASFGTEDPHEFLGRPELALQNPTPKNKKTGAGEYGWPIKDNKTAAHIRQKHYRLIRPVELREDCKYPLATQDGVGDGQVEWENHLMIEIEASYYKRFYMDTAWRSTLQLAARAQAQQQAEAEGQGLHIKTHLDITNSKGFGAN